MQSKLISSDIPLVPVDRSRAVVGGVRSTVVFGMKADTAPRMTLKGILLHVLAYLLWLVNVVVCVAAVIQFHSAANVLWLVLGHSRRTLGVVDQLSVLLGGLAAFIYVVFLESYYRHSVTPRIQKPEGSSDVSMQVQVSHQGRTAQGLTDLRLAVLLRRFAMTIAIPLGLVVASLVMIQVAWRGLY